MRRALLALALALLTLALVVAPSGRADEDPKPTPNTGINGPIAEVPVTLRDGSTVTCLTYDRALDCDWKNQ